MKLKRVQLEESTGPHDLVLGIVSDVPIWKLGWDLNRILEISLKKLDLPQDLPLEKTKASPLLTLFEPEQLETLNQSVACYEDSLTHPSQIYLLLENDLRISPKKIRAFRYFFVIRTRTITEKETIDWMQLIKESEHVRTVVNLSTEENLNNIQY
ncbi:MAG: hypothetical protein AAGC85_13280 [Bacteroidota bacterium]